jgi:hypothetical protein
MKPQPKNQFRGLEVHKDTRSQPINYTAWIIAMVILLAMYMIAHEFGLITVTNSQGL